MSSPSPARQTMMPPFTYHSLFRVEFHRARFMIKEKARGFFSVLLFYKKKGTAMAAKSIHIKVDGMSCQHCVETIEKALGDVDGIIAVTVDLNGGTVSVEYDSSRLSEKAISDTIGELGYEVA